MDSNDLALVAQQIREMMTRVTALDTKQAIPDFDSKMASVVAQMESLKSLLPPPEPEPEEVEPAAPQELVAKPKEVSMQAFAAENTPPPGDMQSLIVSLFSDAKPEDERAFEEDESVWKLDWSVMPDASSAGSGIRPPADPDPTPKPPPKKDLWDDLSERGS